MRADWATCLGSRENSLVWKVHVLLLGSLSTPLINSPLGYSVRSTPPVRGIGTSLATATNWSANLIINSTYLSLMAKITPSGAFGFYAGLCLLGCIFCTVCFPETAGLSLEEVRWVFEDGFGIRRSKELREKKWAVMAGLVGGKNA